MVRHLHGGAVAPRPSVTAGLSARVSAIASAPALLVLGIAIVTDGWGRSAHAASPYFDAPWRAFETSETSAGPGRFLLEVATGDLDGDGLDDVVTTQGVIAGGLRVFLSQGSAAGPPATFAPPVFYPTTHEAWDVVLVDLDGDGDLDVAASQNDVTGTVAQVALFANLGAGALAAPVYVPAGPQGVAGIDAADVDGDGDQDLVVANWGRIGLGNDVSLLLNDGTGSFAAPLSYAVRKSPTRLAAGDLDGDGLPDLAVAHDDAATVSILLGAGDGSFGPAVEYTHVFTPSNAAANAALVLLDADADGDLDIAYTSSYAYDQSVNDGKLGLLRNDGTGSFTVHRYPYGLPFENVAFDLAAADLDGDPYPDLIGAQFHEAGFLAFRADGTGGYLPPVAVASADEVIAAAAPDLDGDGDSDVATVNRLYPLLGVHENPGDGEFPRLPIFGEAFVHYVVDLGDVDGDGNLDAVTSHSGASASTVNVYLGGGDGTFAQSWVSPQAAYGYAKLRDLDGDGVLDLLFVAGPSAPPYDFFTARGNGNGTFAGIVRWAVPSCGAAHPAAFDLDGDGDLDVINTEDRGCPGIPDAGRRLFISLNHGDGTFAPPSAVVAGSFPRNVDAGDFDEDGALDLAVVGTSTDAILFGHGDGTFEPWVAPAASFISDNILVGDWDGDGHDDVAALAAVSSGVSAIGLLWGDGQGNFLRQSPGMHPALDARLVLASGDVDGDGDADLFLDGEQDALVFVNEGGREFSDGGRYGLGRDGRALTYGDATGDGVGDLIALATNEQPSALYGGLVVLPGLRTDPAEVEPTLPVGTELGFEAGLLQPNPFTTSAQFRLEVRETQAVTAELVDAAGRKVATVFRGSLDAGTPRIFAVERAGLPSGVYWLAIHGESFQAVRKAVIVE